MSRRAFFGTAAGSAGRVALAARGAGLKIGVMDTVLRLAGNPQAVAVAKKLGLAALQVTLGKSPDGKSLPLENREIQSAWVPAAEEHSVPLNSTYLDMLHSDCLKDSAKAPMWVRKGIDITKRLHAGVLMLAFFWQVPSARAGAARLCHRACEGTRARS